MLGIGTAVGKSGTGAIFGSREKPLPSQSCSILFGVSAAAVIPEAVIHVATVAGGADAAELLLDIAGHGPLSGFPPDEPALEALGHDLVERSRPTS